MVDDDDGRGGTRPMTKWEQDWCIDICTTYELLTLDASLPFDVVDDIDELGIWHGLALRCKRETPYGVMRDALPMFVEHFDEREFPRLTQMEVGSLMKCWKLTEGDELTYLYGPGSLLQHRHRYVVRFGKVSEQMALGVFVDGKPPRVTAGGVGVWRLKGAALISSSGAALKSTFKRWEILSVSYASNVKLREDCRCLHCHGNRKRRERDAERKARKREEREK